MVWWTYYNEKNIYEFEFKMFKKDKVFVMTKYLDYVRANALTYQHQLQELYLYNNRRNNWYKNDFKHPSTFAMEPGLKKKSEI
jgi:hypothetical protein